MAIQELGVRGGLRRLRAREPAALVGAEGGRRNEELGKGGDRDGLILGHDQSEREGGEEEEEETKY
jgi:hypothetical protein